MLAKRILGRPGLSQQAQTATGMFLQLLAQQDLASVPILVLANKQDLATSVCATQLRAHLGLDHKHLVADRVCHLLGTSASTGEGTKEALEWLAAAIDKSRKGARRPAPALATV